MPGVTGVREITAAVERLAPPELAEGWDNSGLQVGDLAANAGRVLVALTPLPEVFDEAEETGADFLLFHHPLIFSPMKSVRTGSYPGDLVARAISKDLTVYAAHTSYDAAPDGVSVALANAVGLRGPLEVVSPRGAVRKLAVFVPVEDAEAVAEALAGAGAGRIGDYTRCTFRSPGTGTFLPGEGSDPYLGKRGRLERVEEVRLETVVPAHLARNALDAATDAHPYEEVALDVYPVEGFPEGCGYGRIGALPGPLTPPDVAAPGSGSPGFPARPRHLHPRRSREPRRVPGRLARPRRHRRRPRRDGAALAHPAGGTPRRTGRCSGSGEPREALVACRRFVGGGPSGHGAGSTGRSTWRRPEPSAFIGGPPIGPLRLRCCPAG